MPISLIQCLHDTPLAFVDVETTGASADFGHRVIEIGICRVEGGRVVAEYEQLIDPRRRISAGVTALTGISQSMVDGKPTFTEQFPQMLPLLQRAVVLGHNVRFDLGFLRREFRRCGTELTAALGDGTHVLDTVRIARRRFGRGGNGLQSLAPRLGMQPAVAHRALADAHTTAFVFDKLMEPVGGWSCCVCDAIREQGGPMGLMPVSPRESLLPLELEEALEQKCAVRMEYLDARQKRTERVIEPLTVRRRGGELILVAWCHMRNDRRTFKLERIVQMTRVEVPPKVTPPPVAVTAPQPQAAQVIEPSLEPATIVLEPIIPDEAPAAPAENPSIIDPTPCPPTEAATPTSAA
jgi:DNA polymerase III epsilon subunit family exonuclease